MVFKVKFWDVTRDSMQGLTGNRAPLDDALALESYELGNQLKVTALAQDSVAQFAGQEGGGAHPQVTSRLLGKEFTRAVRAKRDAAPHSTERPLWRGNNGWVLQKIHANEQEHLIRQELEDVAFEEGVESDNPLTIKVFDSQANRSEVETTIKIVAKINEENINQGIRNQMVGVEYAIPYSCGKHHSPNPYSDEFYLSKVDEAIEVFEANQANIPANLFRISLKDMVGELTGEDSTRLTNLIVQKLAAYKERTGNELGYGLHLHNSGFAVDAYANAIEVCKEQDWSISCDYVSGTQANYNLDASDEEVGTGFASAIKINDKLKERGLLKDGILTDNQIDILKQKGQKTDALLEKYKLRRAKIKPELYQLVRDCHLAGGAFSSFRDAVAEKKIAEQLTISNEEALRIASLGLNVAGYLMGQPLSVTPAMLHRQSASLHLLNNMIEADYFKDCTDAKAIENKLIQIAKDNGTVSLSDEEIKELFLGGIDKNVAMQNVMSFLIDPVPGDFYEKSQGRNNRGLHPVITQALGKVAAQNPEDRTGEIKEECQKLYAAGKLGPDNFQINRVLRKNKTLSNNQKKQILNYLQENQANADTYTITTHYKKSIDVLLQSFTFEDNSKLSQENLQEIANALEIATINSATANAIVTTPERFYQLVEKEWFVEIDASIFGNDFQGYHRALDKGNKGQNPYPNADPAEEILNDYNKNLNERLANLRLSVKKEKEKRGINISVEEFISKNAILVAQFIATQDEDLLESLAKDILSNQVNIINKKLEQKGEKFILSKYQRITQALEIFTQTINNTNREIDANKLFAAMKQIIDEELSREVNALTPGTVDECDVEVGDEVKKGQRLFLTNFAKMYIDVKSQRSGIVDEILVAKGDNFVEGQKLLTFKAKEKEEKKEKEALPNPTDTQTKTLQNVLSETIYQADLDREAALININRQIKELETVKQDDFEYAKSGYNVSQNLSSIQNGEAIKKKTIHVIINRAGCATKIAGDLESYGCEDIRFLYVQDDKNLPILQATADDKKTPISDYKAQEEIIAQLKKIRDANPDMQIACHPGWGMLSEVSEFAALCEAEERIIFAGPPSKPMHIAGGKKTFRDLVEEVTPHFNPAYLGSSEDVSLEQLRSYFASIKNNDLNIDSNIDEIYRKEFDRIINEQNGDCVIKAVAGGGGKGIEFFEYDKTLEKEENYQAYLEIFLQNREYARKENYKPEDMLIEQCIRGNAQHVEVQMAADGNGKAAIVGLRNCMIQTAGQKFAEMNIKEGDYDQIVIDKINEASQALSEKLSKEGYKGVGTLEMMLIPGATPQETKVKFLELNTRIQVEHAVTEKDAMNKTGKPLSLPLLNTILTCENRDIDEVLANDFGFDANDRKSLQGVAKERVTHFRINAKTLDLEKGGEPLPTGFIDALWDIRVSSLISKKYGVDIVHGGKGGNFDAQVGAMWGDEDKVKAAATELQKHFQAMQEIYRMGNATNLNNIIEIYDSMFKDGNVRPEVATSTVNDFLKAKEQGFEGRIADYVAILPKVGSKSTAPSSSVLSQSADKVTNDNEMMVGRI